MSVMGFEPMSAGAQKDLSTHPLTLRQQTDKFMIIY